LINFFAMHGVHIPLTVIKGRGAASAIAHRFVRDNREAFDDGWHESSSQDDELTSPIATQVRFERAKSAISHNQSPDMYFTQGLNPYRGCEHGCIYCYARPTHSYLGLSPGLDFETQIIAKSNLAEVLACELQAKRYAPSAIAIGTVTDAYQPVERELRITRSVLEVFSKCHHPISIITKGSGRCEQCLFHRAAATMGAEPFVPRMAGFTLPRSRWACHGTCS
jgi:hypothetical protein